MRGLQGVKGLADGLCIHCQRLRGPGGALGAIFGQLHGLPQLLNGIKGLFVVLIRQVTGKLGEGIAGLQGDFFQHRADALTLFDQGRKLRQGRLEVACKALGFFKSLQVSRVFQAV